MVFNWFEVYIFGQNKHPIEKKTNHYYSVIPIIKKTRDFAASEQKMFDTGRIAMKLIGVIDLDVLINDLVLTFHLT